MSPLQTAVPDGWKLSSTIRRELPESERARAAAHLWGKSAGRCQLCNLPLPSDGKHVAADHFVAREEADGGETKLENLYLAHRRCNSSRRNLPFAIARQLIQFATWCEAEPRRSFTEVTTKFVTDPNKRCTFSREGSSITVSFGHTTRTATIAVDPATETEYFFMDAPISFIKNDDESQPRFIEADHIRTLALDFAKHPVHEPSNCRFATTADGLADLLQFDGQHKTTAQIVLGREEVPMKFYIDPDEAMIQELVVQIQQGIKKRPLSTTDTLKKLDDVIQAWVATYRDNHQGQTPTEQNLVESRPKQDRPNVKKHLLSNLDFLVMDEQDFKLRHYASKRTSKNQPFTDTVLTKRLIKPLMSQELVTNETMDQADQRDRERAKVAHILNAVADHMLTDKWNPESVDDLHTRRARNFFYQASIGFWMNELLLPSLKITMSGSKKPQMFRNALAEAEHERIDDLISTLCGWEIWSTTDPAALAAMRSNTVSRVADAFPEHNQQRLMTESQS